MAGRLSSILPQFILDYGSRLFFHIQFFLEDFTSFAPFHYLVIAILYIFFFAFGISFHGLTGVTLALGKKSTRENRGSFLVELLFLLISCVGIFLFFTQGYREYSQPDKVLSNSRKVQKPASWISRLQVTLRRVFHPLKQGQSFYIWHYNPFYRNLFLLFNPLQIALFMIQKRVGVQLKIALVIINILMSVMLYLMMYLFEEKSKAEKKLASEVMKVQQDFYVKWNEVRRLAEREYVNEIMENIDSDSVSRLSSISSRAMKAVNKGDRSERESIRSRHSRFSSDEEMEPPREKKSKRKQENPFQVRKA